jgi:L-asparaginase
MSALVSSSKTLIVLGTGGTIAGTASSAQDHTGYTAAQLSVEQLLASVPGLSQALKGATLESEQVAQLDSKDMDFATMTRLAQRCAHHVQRPEVVGIVITHGTDTLEETAYFLHLVLGGALPQIMARKPVVLTCAMRPATSSEADGPSNLRDAVQLTLDADADSQARGVLAVCAGDVHHAALVQKVHTFALNAFSSGTDAAGASRVLAKVQGQNIAWNTSEQQIYQENRPLVWKNIDVLATKLIANTDLQSMQWPRVEIVLNHAYQDGNIVRALLAASTPADPLRGIVVAGTGNATLSELLVRELKRVEQSGVAVRLCSRCTWDGLLTESGNTRANAFKTRVELILELLHGQ